MAILVHFNRGLTIPDAERLRGEYGLRLELYVPSDAFIERLTAEAASRLARDFLVRACERLAPLLKLAPGAAAAEEYDAMLFDDDAAVVSSIEARGATQVRILDDRAIGGRVHVRFAVDAAQRLAEIAELDDVLWIEPVAPLVPHNREAAAVMQSGLPARPSIWNRGLHGEGQVIGVLDEGPPNLNHCFLSDASVEKPGPTHRKVLELRNPSDHVWDSHATFVAGIAAGDEDKKSGTNPHRSLAYGAKLVCGSTDGVKANGLLSELDLSAKAGAFIHTNSFGSRTIGSVPSAAAAYNASASAADAFTWANESHLVIGSAGNVGESLHAPGTAKNALCVTAAAQDAAGKVTVGDGNAGPTPDGRRKPDLMAIGCGITSAAGTGCETVPEPCATSWAAPQAAAAAALVRQYFTEGFYPTGVKRARQALTPSGALLKAVLLNSTVDTLDPEGYPSKARGWGLIQLERTLYFGGETRALRVWDVRHAAGILAGHQRYHEFRVLSKDEPLKITLVWTEEPPATPTATKPTVHSVDMRITAPTGTRYRANNFTSGASIPNDITRDRTNNVQMVVLKAPETGEWEIEITTDVSRPKRQGYALVVSGTVIPSLTF